MYRAIFAFCRKKKKNNLWLFKKCWKNVEKKCFFYWCSYTLCIQTIMNTNKVNVGACLLFTTLSQPPGIIQVMRSVEPHHALFSFCNQSAFPINVWRHEWYKHYYNDPDCTLWWDRHHFSSLVKRLLNAGYKSGQKLSEKVRILFVNAHDHNNNLSFLLVQSIVFLFPKALTFVIPHMKRCV